MAWAKAKTPIIASACVALAVAAAAIIIAFCRETPVRGIPKNWSVISSDPDEWNWTNGVICGHTTTGLGVLASSREYRDVTLSAVVGTTNREGGLALRLQDAENGYFIIFAPGGTLRDDAGHIALVKRVDGQETILGSYRGRIFSSMGQSAKVTVIARGSWIQVHLNDVTVLRIKDTTFSSGFIGLRIYGDPDSPCNATFSNVAFY